MTPNEEFGGMGNHAWGESVLAATFDAIKNADSTAANIASLVFEAKIDIIRVPQFSANIGNQAYEDAVLRRYTLANAIKGVNGTLILDAEEDYDSKSAPLSGLTDILMAFMQIVSGAADIPVTRLLGQSPAGLNATGAADMKKTMTMHEFLDALGIKAGVVIAGLSGGILRGLSRRRYTMREIVASPICGALAAAYLTEPVLFYLRAINWPLPQKDVAAMNATAFVVGVCAMWIADLIFDAISRWVKGGHGVP